MRMEVLFIPMGSKAKGIIKGKVFCEGSGIKGDFWEYGTKNYNPKTFITYPIYMKHFFPGGAQGVRNFFSKGRPVRKIIDSDKLYAPYHLHPCDRIL